MAANSITIDLEGGKGYAGLGDIVMLAWLAEGCRRAGQSVAFHRTRNPDLLDLFELTVDPVPGGVRLGEAYQAELADRGRRPQLDYIRDFLGVTAEPVRPPVRIPEEHRARAADRVGELGGPPVLLFPQTAWLPREWPASYWVDVAWRLKEAGRPVMVLLTNKDERFTNTPSYWWGLPFGRVAALMERAAVVVGNDSFPAPGRSDRGADDRGHGADPADGVRPRAGGRVPSVGPGRMHRVALRRPVRAACDQGCLSLYRLFPGDVLRKVLG